MHPARNPRRWHTTGCARKRPGKQPSAIAACKGDRIVSEQARTIVSTKSDVHRTSLHNSEPRSGCTSSASTKCSLLQALHAIGVQSHRQERHRPSRLATRYRQRHLLAPASTLQHTHSTTYDHGTTSKIHLGRTRSTATIAYRCGSAAQRTICSELLELVVLVQSINRRLYFLLWLLRASTCASASPRTCTATLSHGSFAQESQPGRTATVRVFLRVPSSWGGRVRFQQFDELSSIITSARGHFFLT